MPGPVRNRLHRGLRPPLCRPLPHGVSRRLQSPRVERHSQAECERTDFVGECRRGCVDGCVAANRERAGGVRYGRRQNINHNLLRILDAAGTLVVENTFEPDPTSPAFDSVVTQRNGDFNLAFHYRDLDAERRGVVSPPPNGPARQFVGELANIDYLDVCLG